MLEWIEAHQLPCLFRTILGIECPGCGFQRAFIFLFRGDVWASVKIWPALIPLLVFLCLAILRLVGLKKIGLNLLKTLGFICLIIILISYLLKLNAGLCIR